MRRIAFIFLLVTASLAAQSAKDSSVLTWQMQASGTTAGLRGIDSVDGKVAWASGTNGTVLRTTDGGEHWTQCAIPDADKDGATLDFRGIQAWDDDTAIIMSSGPGEKSRLYKTTNGCSKWTLLLKNTDPNGFYDSFWLNAIYGEGILLGDPVGDRFSVYNTQDGGVTWKQDKSASLELHGISQGAFAASNSSIGRALRGDGDARGTGIDFFPGFVTGGKSGTFLFERWEGRSRTKSRYRKKQPGWPPPDWNKRSLPLAGGTDSAGAFALALRYTGDPCSDCAFGKYWTAVAVGGEYTKPNESAGTAAWSTDGGQHWTASTTPPHGYRSTVAWSPDLKAWITAGTNGSDISRDDGKTWSPIDDDNWNALSLPFVVGPKGRIARLTTTVPAPKP